MDFLKDLAEKAYGYADEVLKHHKKVNKITVRGKEFLIEEQVTDKIGHEMYLKIIKSPGGKLNGFTTSKYGGGSSKAARKLCMFVIEDMVKDTYG